MVMSRLFGVILVAVFSASSAHGATPTPACTSANLAKAYNGGVSKAGIMWNLFLCPNFPNCCSDDMEKLILNVIDLQRPQSVAGACEIGGFVQELDALYLEACIPVCREQGDQTGLFYGAAYCKIASALGCVDVGQFVRPGVLSCGWASQIACDASFDEITGAQCPTLSMGNCSIAQDNCREMICTYPK
jgi:hypothetical protein